MARPIAPVLVLGGAAGGGHTLLRAGSRASSHGWFVSFALPAGGASDDAMRRHTPLRIAIFVSVQTWHALLEERFVRA